MTTNELVEALAATGGVSALIDLVSAFAGTLAGLDNEECADFLRGYFGQEYLDANATYEARVMLTAIRGDGQ